MNGIKRLTSILTKCFDKRKSLTKDVAERSAMLMKALPTSLSEEEAEKLAQRLVMRCRYMPSIAEIVDEWQLMAREKHMNSYYEANQTVKKPNRATIRRIRQIQRDVSEGKPFPQPETTPEMIQFARQYFRNISEETVTRNWLEISVCMRENEKETKNNSRYRTVMHLEKDGTIELFMRKIA